VSRHSALLRQSQSRGNAVAAIVNNGLKSNSSSTLKSSPSSNNVDDLNEAPPDFVRLGIQRMLEQAQQHSNDNKYNGGSHTSEIENSKALQALELVHVRTYVMHVLYYFVCVRIQEKSIIVHRGDALV
jgi:hypothetical protein